MTADFTKGDLFILPLNHHIPCSIPISRLIGTVLTYYSGCRSEIVNTGQASLAFAPDAQFLHGVHDSCVVQSIQRGRTPNFYTISLLPQVDHGSIAIFSYVHDARRKDSCHARVCPVSLEGLVGDVLLVWQQIIQETHLGMMPDFYDRILRPDQDLTQQMIEVGVTAGISLAQNGSFDSARRVWTSLLEDYGTEQPEVLLNIGQSYSDEGNYEEADEWLSLAIDKATSNSTKLQAHYNRGLARANMAAHASAISDFQICIRTQPSFAMAYNSVGACYMEMGNRVEATEWFRKCLNLRPDPTDITREEALELARMNLSRL